MVGLGQHTRKPLQIWVADGVLALNGGDEIVDELMLRTVGEWLQRATWIGLAENVAKAAGGTARPIETTREELSDHELGVVNTWAATLDGQLSRNSKSSGRD